MPETCVIGFVKRWLLAVLAITFYFSRGTIRGQLTSRKKKLTSNTNHERKHFSEPDKNNSEQKERSSS